MDRSRPSPLVYTVAAAERLRRILAPLAEHDDDGELAPITCALAATTLLVAKDLGLSDCFRRS